jgi:hypothetical protein
MLRAFSIITIGALPATILLFWVVIFLFIAFESKPENGHSYHFSTEYIFFFSTWGFASLLGTIAIWSCAFIKNKFKIILSIMLLLGIISLLFEIFWLSNFEVILSGRSIWLAWLVYGPLFTGFYLLIEKVYQFNNAKYI